MLKKWFRNILKTSVGVRLQLMKNDPVEFSEFDPNRGEELH